MIKLQRKRVHMRKPRVDIEETIKVAFSEIVKLIERNLQHMKSSISPKRQAKLSQDLSMLRMVSLNPIGYFMRNTNVDEIVKKFSDLARFSTYLSSQNIDGKWLLESLILYTSYFCQDDFSQYDVEKNIIELNKIIQLRSATGIMWIVSLFLKKTPAKHFAVFENEK